MSKATPLTLEKLIKAAGGTNFVATRCGLTSSAVSQWIKAGRLPLSEIQGQTDYAPTLIELAGIDADVWDVRLIGRR